MTSACGAGALVCVFVGSEQESGKPIRPRTQHFISQSVFHKSRIPRIGAVQITSQRNPDYVAPYVQVPLKHAVSGARSICLPSFRTIGLPVCSPASPVGTKESSPGLEVLGYSRLSLRDTRRGAVDMSRARGAGKQGRNIGAPEQVGGLWYRVFRPR